MGEKYTSGKGSPEAKKTESLRGDTPSTTRGRIKDIPFEVALFRARVFEHEVRAILRQNPKISQSELVKELTKRLGEDVLPGAATAVAQRFYAERRQRQKKSKKKAT